MVLRDLIAPYLLRRRKADVSAQLPRKTEQVQSMTPNATVSRLAAMLLMTAAHWASLLSSRSLAESPGKLRITICFPAVAASMHEPLRQ